MRGHRERRGCVELAISSAKIWNTPLGVVIFLTCIFMFRRGSRLAWYAPVVAFFFFSSDEVIST